VRAKVQSADKQHVEKIIERACCVTMVVLVDKWLATTTWKTNQKEAYSVAPRVNKDPILLHTSAINAINQLGLCIRVKCALTLTSPNKDRIFMSNYRIHCDGEYRQESLHALLSGE
jgi:hypothetical protein